MKRKKTTSEDETAVKRSEFLAPNGGKSPNVSPAENQEHFAIHPKRIERRAGRQQDAEGRAQGLEGVHRYHHGFRHAAISQPHVHSAANMQTVPCQGHALCQSECQRSCGVPARAASSLQKAHSQNKGLPRRRRAHPPRGQQNVPAFVRCSERIPARTCLAFGEQAPHAQAERMNKFFSQIVLNYVTLQRDEIDMTILLHKTLFVYYHKLKTYKSIQVLVIAALIIYMIHTQVHISLKRRVVEDALDCHRFPYDAHMQDAESLKQPITSQNQIKRYFHSKQMSRQVVTNDLWGGAFFQRNWEPSVSCDVIARVGCPGDGGKWVCDPHVILSPKNECVVYSVGSNNDFGFEEAVHDLNPTCEIHTFDPTISQPTHRPPYVRFHPYGVGLNSPASSSFRLFSIQEIMKHLGHDAISILKIDCEGCEYDAFTRQATLKGIVKQILMEVHFNYPHQTHNLFNSLTSQGFAIYSKEANIQYSDGSAVEFSLVDLDWLEPITS